MSEICPTASHQLMAASIAFKRARKKFPTNFGSPEYESTKAKLPVTDTDYSNDEVGSNHSSVKKYKTPKQTCQCRPTFTSTNRTPNDDKQPKIQPNRYYSLFPTACCLKRYSKKHSPLRINNSIDNLYDVDRSSKISKDYDGNNHRKNQQNNPKKQSSTILCTNCRSLDFLQLRSKKQQFRKPHHRHHYRHQPPRSRNLRLNQCSYRCCHREDDRTNSDESDNDYLTMIPEPLKKRDNNKLTRYRNLHSKDIDEDTETENDYEQQEEDDIAEIAHKDSISILVEKYKNKSLQDNNNNSNNKRPTKKRRTIINNKFEDRLDRNEDVVNLKPYNEYNDYQECKCKETKIDPIVSSRKSKNYGHGDFKSRYNF